MKLVHLVFLSIAGFLITFLGINIYQHTYSSSITLCDCPRVPDYSSDSSHINVFGISEPVLDSNTGSDIGEPFRDALVRRLSRNKQTSVCFYKRGPD